MTSGQLFFTRALRRRIAASPQQFANAFFELCEPFELVLSAELGVCGEELSHAYFPSTGFISLVIEID